MVGGWYDELGDWEKLKGKKKRNQLHFYTLTTNYLNEKLRKQCHLKLHQNNKIVRNKFNQGSERHVH